MAANYALGIDIGGTQVKLVRVTPEGEILEQRSFLTNDSEAQPWVKAVQDQLHSVTESWGSPAAVGVAGPGIAAPDGSGIWWMAGRMQALQGLDWSAALGRPCPVLNDAQAALVGEVWLGAAKGYQNAMLLTLGTGIGGAAIVDGRILRGHLGRAGHLGHISLDPLGTSDIVRTPGSLEDAFGECTLEARSGGVFRHTADLVAAVGAGESDAVAIWNRSLDALGAGVASLINVLDPEVVVIGGGIAAAGDVLFDGLSNRLDRWEWRPHLAAVRVVPAQLGGWAGAIGAAKNALDNQP